MLGFIIGLIIGFAVGTAMDAIFRAYYRRAKNTIRLTIPQHALRKAAEKLQADFIDKMVKPDLYNCRSSIMPRFDTEPLAEDIEDFIDDITDDIERRA